MACVVRTGHHAEQDLALLFERIGAAESDSALDWYLGIKQAILSLENNPSRCPMTPEGFDVRHLLYGNRPNIYRIIYRIIFRIEERQRRVEVLTIRHGASQPLRRSDLK